MKIYCDSSTREGCFVLDGQQPIIIPYKEQVTNNVGEYQIVILVLELAQNNHWKGVEILTDSQLVVRHYTGDYKCRAKHLIPLWKRTRDLAWAVGATITWIPREENLAGRFLG